MEEHGEVASLQPLGSSRRQFVAVGAFLLALAVLVLGGCSNGPDRTPSDKPASKKPSAPTETEAPPKPATAADVTLTTIDKAAYDAFLQKHRGKVILVDFWATWCKPCVDLLPHTAEVAKKWGDRGLVVATVSMDEPDQEQQAKKTLASNGAAGLENFLAKPGAPDDPQNDPFTVFVIPGGALPHFKLYTADGKLAQTFDWDKRTPEAKEIDAALEAALK